MLALTTEKEMQALAEEPWGLAEDWSKQLAAQPLAAGVAWSKDLAQMKICVLLDACLIAASILLDVASAHLDLHRA